ncbi:MAG: VirB8/TrbF family protein [Sphingomonadaceae bacterium]
MNDQTHPDLDEALTLDSWAQSPLEVAERSRRTAWIVASVAAALALLLAVALVFLVPLKETEPYTLLVDRQTGHVEALSPLESHTVQADTALTRSMLAQYVIARESYDYSSLQRDYRRVALWSAGDVRRTYMRQFESGNTAGPIATYGQGATVQVEIKSVSSLSARQSLVRYVTRRSDRGGVGADVQHWAAVIDYRFVEGGMTADDRLLNPLGFQVTRYRRDAETLPEIVDAEPTGAVDVE